MKKSITQTSINDIVVQRSYQNDIEHRMEWLRTYSGVDFINDSKATDIHATLFSLSELNIPVNWIVMETDEVVDYSFFKEIVEEKVKSIIYVGRQLPESFKELISIVECFAETEDLEQAANIALEFSCTGEVVLFSPASSAHPYFSNYKERGDAFKKIVNRLK